MSRQYRVLASATAFCVVCCSTGPPGWLGRSRRVSGVGFVTGLAALPAPSATSIASYASSVSRALRAVWPTACNWWHRRLSEDAVV
jgi:hypothetical protein